MEDPEKDGKVPLYENVNKERFLREIYPKRVPAILRGVDIGPCIDLWTTDYLCQKGGNRQVKIHVCPTAQMDFINKNFAYRTLPFDEFVRRAAEEKHTDFFHSQDEKYYLRSLGEDPRKDVADIRTQFPELADDIIFPEFFAPSQFFSSVFRIGSPSVQLWTHYDIMDNLLIQVSGRKRVVLFSPRDATHLYLTGDKSAVLDLENPDLERFPQFSQARPYTCTLQPGDILFLPALWFHNVVSLDFGVAVNIFWRHLDPGFYDNKDPYGNKDLLSGQRALQILDRALKTLEELPVEYRDFYGRRMVSKIQQTVLDKELP
ncbi:PREDICTED: tRNA wybutosine-synthesizing protein 5-like [Branchiostoma belcheri]|uniref:tRNA wybutosine-synthesizing protein 5 n=1 Tax=Branchiostoma belcheri TaxID=7741 RepID=A0A6P4Y0Q6_BRABE|nr:PREDICTED: tRNA wybutosine-synthesizing protein 5-like [Branchiostoma belcheri]